MTEQQLGHLLEEAFWWWLGLGCIEALFLWCVMTIHEILDWWEARKERRSER